MSIHSRSRAASTTAHASHAVAARDTGTVRHIRCNAPAEAAKEAVRLVPAVGVRLVSAADRTGRNAIGAFAGRCPFWTCLGQSKGSPHCCLVMKRRSSKLDCQQKGSHDGGAAGFHVWTTQEMTSPETAHEQPLQGLDTSYRRSSPNSSPNTRQKARACSSVAFLPMWPTRRTLELIAPKPFEMKNPLSCSMRRT